MKALNRLQMHQHADLSRMWPHEIYLFSTHMTFFSVGAKGEEMPCFTWAVFFLLHTILFDVPASDSAYFTSVSVSTQLQCCSPLS